MSRNKHLRLLITGATGFLGTALVKRLISDTGFDIVAAVRRESSKLVSDALQVIVGDMNATSDWMPALSNIDVVIHVAARVHVMNDTATDPLIEFRKVNFEGTMALARQSVESGVKRFIFISSIKVNGEETLIGQPFTASDDPAPVDPYGISKAETEQALLELAASTGLEVVIIRPVLVYGPGVKANFRSLMKWLNKGVPLPLGLVHNNKRSLVSLDNLIDLIIRCIAHPAAINQIFLVSDDEDLSTSELLVRVSKALQQSAILLPVPVWMISAAATLVGKGDMSKRLLGSLQVDISKTKKMLDWVPPVSVNDGLKMTAEEFLKNEKIF